MKFGSVFVAALAALAVIATPTSASTENVERRLVLGGTTVPKGRKQYYAGMRNTADGKNFCGGTLISPTHVLTASHCVEYDIRWVSVGSHFNTGTEDGEQIRVAAVMNHPNFTIPLKFSNDFAILELETASSFTPAKLAKADVKSGTPVVTVGTGRLSEGSAAQAGHELQRVTSKIISNKECQSYGGITVDNSMLCVAGQISMGFCDGDSGGPLFIEKSKKDVDDVVVGVVSWRNWKDGEVCGRGEGTPMVYSRVSSARKWINPIARSSCFA